MVKINDKNYKVIGIKNDRVIFQLFEKKEHWYDRELPSFKINFHNEGYYVNLPQRDYPGTRKVYMNEILEEFSILQEINDYYKGGKN